MAPDIDGLGYAYLPSPFSLPEEAEDGVVILTEAFGGPNSGAEYPFDLGRTVTHEVGHYLGLDHIWGDGCENDDGISDTPDQEQENVECPIHPSPSCGNDGDMFMNYMDYTDDECLNAFSKGQNLYMRQILATSRAQLVQPGRVDCPVDDGTVVPSCTDGIKNGTETSIDCGGNCKPCEVGRAVDAGIMKVTYMTEVVNCEQMVVLRLSLMNYSATNLSDVTIEVKAGADLLLNYDWTGRLGANAQSTVTLPRLRLSLGSHQLTIRTLNPNGQPDTRPDNDDSNINVDLEDNSRHELFIQPDDYAGDVSWKVVDDQGNVVARGNNYEDFDDTIIHTSMCLSPGCYQLIMMDSYGDGICCDYGRGWYELRDSEGRVLMQSDGYYGYRETQSFCLDLDHNLSEQRVAREARVASRAKR